MWSSAMASSSPVLTPGRTAALTAAIAPAVTSPEARISSISCGVLIWIMRPLHFASSGSRERSPPVISPPARSVRARRSGVVHAQRLHGAGRDLVDLADRVDADELARRLVEAGEGLGLFPVDVQAVPDGLGLVVVALHHLAVDQHPAARETADQLLLVDHELQHAVEGLAQVGER